MGDYFTNAPKNATIKTQQKGEPNGTNNPIRHSPASHTSNGRR